MMGEQAVGFLQSNTEVTIGMAGTRAKSVLVPKNFEEERKGREGRYHVVHFGK
jgi:hypothetical protein